MVSFDEGSPEIAGNLGDPNPENQIEARLFLSKIMKSLAPQDRAILVLHYGEGYSGEEIAKITGLSKTNIKVRAFRIRRKLKAIYDGGYK